MTSPAPPLLRPPPNGRLQVGDIVEELRKRCGDAPLDLSSDESRQKLREHLLQAATESGQSMTEADVDSAMEQYFLARSTGNLAAKTGIAAVVDGGVATALHGLGLLLLLALVGAACLALMTTANTFSRAVRSSRQAGQYSHTIRPLSERGEQTRRTKDEGRPSSRPGQITQR